MKELSLICTEMNLDAAVIRRAIDLNLVPAQYKRGEFFTTQEAIATFVDQFRLFKKLINYTIDAKKIA